MKVGRWGPRLQSGHCDCCEMSEWGGSRDPIVGSPSVLFAHTVQQGRDLGPTLHTSLCGLQWVQKRGD